MTATPKPPAIQPSGMKAFTIVWLGQVVSFIGTGITRFALTIWAWDMTGQATALALVGFFSFAPIVLLSPFAGALVDRWNRKFVMMISDLGAGVSTIAILILYATGNLEVWHLYAAGAFTGVFESFQFPAYSAAVTMMVPKKQYARASGMMSLAEAGSGIFAPMLAGAIIGLAGGIDLGMSIILLLDISTFLVAIFALLVVRIPNPPRTASGAEGQGSLWQEAAYGFKYIFRRPSLLGLQLVFFTINLTATFAIIVMAPMILARTGNNAAILGAVQSTSAVGGVIGALLLSVWGGPKNKVLGVVGGMLFSSLFGLTLLGLGQTVVVWLVAAFLATLFIPILNGSNQAIWQAKVAPDVQGRVFSARRLIAQITAPVAMLAAGPLADYVFEPALLPGGALVPLFSGVVGVGPGAGMSLMIVLAGLMGVFASVVAYAVPAVRHAESLLPDHEVAQASETPLGEPSSVEPNVNGPASPYKSRRRQQVEQAWRLPQAESAVLE